MKLHESQSRAHQGIVTERTQLAVRVARSIGEAVGRIGAGDRIQHECGVLHRSRERAVRIEIRPGRNDARAWYQPERGLDADDAGDLRWTAIGATVIGAECGEGHPAGHDDGRSGARAPGRTQSVAIVRVAHLSGE